MTSPSPSTAAVSRNLGRTEALLALLRSRKRLLVLTHNNPDPDSLGSGMGLRHFAAVAGQVESVFGLSGKILRAENQEMVAQLGIGMVPIGELDPSQFDCVALVDTQPGFGHTIVPEGCTVDIVIDHHVGDEERVPPTWQFDDVRSDIGATSSVVATYFREAGFTPSRDVATALAYGIKTDTADLSRNVSEVDLRAYDFLFPHVDRQKLVAIMRPRLPEAYFQTLKEALRKVRRYEHVALCSLGTIGSAEMVAEVADLLLRMEGVTAVFCGGLVDCTYYVSVRTEIGGDAWRLIAHAMAGEKGTFGGHGSVAGGSITLPCGDTRTLRRLERRLERNILRSVGVAKSTPKGLVDKDD
ncbi:MAG: bifunctional oligoribonuclease/PAP phosphatase NrnA [Planctomycetota bacterium]